jgi:hypothetical protein
VCWWVHHVDANVGWMVHVNALATLFNFQKLRRVVREERSVFWEMLALLIVRKKYVHMNMYLIQMVTEIELFESTNTKPLSRVIRNEKLLSVILF